MPTDGPADDDDYGGDGDICGYPKPDGDPCQFPSQDGYCHMHPPEDRADGHGSGDPDHNFGDGPGDIQEKVDKPNMDHGLVAVQNDPAGTLTWLEDNDPKGYKWVVSKWQDYLSDAPFDEESSKSDDLLHACLMKYAVRQGRHRQVSRGLTKMVTTQGEHGEFDVEEESPVNLPTNRIQREARNLLKDLGVLDDPESKKADAMGWSAAAKEIALESNDN